MNELAAVVAQEIAWQQALWNGDYANAYEAAREVLGGLNNEALRGYRALWHYLAGSAAELAAADGEVAFEAQARSQFKKAKEAASGIPWLVALARGLTSITTPEEKSQAAVMVQVERLEAYLAKLGTLHNRAFTAREKEIRTGLQAGNSFEHAQVMLGEHLGFAAGKRETDASPDPWWMVGDVVFVFEDHANAKAEGAVVDATKARQAASHPDWMRTMLPGAAEATVYSVLVTPAKAAKQGAIPHLKRVSYWGLKEFRDWADPALDSIRALRRTFVEPGDLAWRAHAATELVSKRIDAPGLATWLTVRLASEQLKAIP